MPETPQAKFRVEMREAELPRSENPFKPISIIGTRRRREAVVEAESEEAVREFFADAVRRNMPSVRGFELVSVTALEENSDA